MHGKGTSMAELTDEVWDDRWWEAWERARRADKAGGESAAGQAWLVMLAEYGDPPAIEATGVASRPYPDERSAAERVSAADVVRFAERCGLELTPWQAEAMEHLYSGQVVVKGRQNGWSTIRRLIDRAEHSDGPFVEQIIDETHLFTAAEHEGLARRGWLGRMLDRVFG